MLICPTLATLSGGWGAAHRTCLPRGSGSAKLSTATANDSRACGSACRSVWKCISSLACAVTQAAVTSPSGVEEGLAKIAQHRPLRGSVQPSQLRRSQTSKWKPTAHVARTD